MKKLLILVTALIALAAVSCTELPDSGSKFTIVGNTTEGDIVEFFVTPSDQNISYVVGLLEESVLMEIGGEAGLVSFVSQQVSSASNTHSGTKNFSYPGLQPIVKWYLYAAEVENGSVVGAPTLSAAVRIYEPYSEYLCEQFCVPVAISDNGLYIVGTYNGASFVYDRAFKDAVYVKAESSILVDVDDYGVAYGEIDGAPISVTNAEPKFINLPQGASTGGVHAVSPDGSKYYGWYIKAGEALNDGKIKPFVCDNGEFRNLSIEGSKSFSYIDNKTNDTAYCDIIGASVNLGQCAANGALAGYALDNGPCWEQGVVWYPDGTFKVIGEGKMFYDFSWSYPGCEYIFGDSQSNRISPNGKYAAGICVRSYEDIDLPTVLIPYIYNMETGELLMAEESECTPFKSLKVDGVSSKGYVFLSDVEYLQGDIPYVWTPESGIMTLEGFLENIYGSVDPTMKGSVRGTSLDGDTYILGYDVESPKAGTLTSIYTF